MGGLPMPGGWFFRVSGRGVLLMMFTGVAPGHTQDNRLCERRRVDGVADPPSVSFFAQRVPF